MYCISTAVEQSRDKLNNMKTLPVCPLLLLLLSHQGPHHVQGHGAVVSPPPR